MRLREYTQFVIESDWTKGRPAEDRLTVARYGIASEIGSLVAALKKKVLQSSNDGWNVPTDEIEEELGDVLWYTTMLATLTEHGSIQEVIKADMEALPAEIEAKEQFKKALPSGNFDRFVSEAGNFLIKYEDADFSSYQEIAILTARTREKVLLDVCATRLMLYATSIMSRQFPNVEYHLKDDILDFSAKRTLGMVIWHLSAISKLYNISFNEIASNNYEKLNSLYNLRGDAYTPLHDAAENVPAAQRFPRIFSVAFLAAGPGRLQMYIEGKPLGDEIDDNSEDEDGYRFHDVMHLANIAKLGWSPVLRGLMRRKRKFSPQLDRNEDGARAQIVEEAVVKAIHSEGKRIGQAEDVGSGDDSLFLFTRQEQIPFSFLKLIKTFVAGLEVEKNAFWEWKEAILSGHQIYTQLRKVGQGTVFLDLDKRLIDYSPNVHFGPRGAVLSVVNQGYNLNDEVDQTCLTDTELESIKQADQSRLIAEKRAIAEILGLDPLVPESLKKFAVTRLGDSELSVSPNDQVRALLWRHGILSFRSYTTRVGAGFLCSVNALGKLAH